MARMLSSIITVLLASLVAKPVLAKPVLAKFVNDQDFGVGFDLTPAYGTAAVAYGNGSKIALARVDGDESWRKLMLDLHLRKENWDEFPPETVPVLADMLRSLRSATEIALGLTVHSATINVPAIHNTYAQPWQKSFIDVVREAFTAADMRFVQINRNNYYGDPVLYPETSILAGHDIGLCQPYTISRQACMEQESGLLSSLYEIFFLVGYYANEMEVTISTYGKVAYGSYPSPYVDFELGSEMRYRNPDEAYYWEEVQKFLGRSLAEYYREQKPSKVIVYGDESGDERFRETVKEVLGMFLSDYGLPEWVDDGVSPEFAGAMGAAEFVLRKPYWDTDDPFVNSLTVQSPAS